jgi:hypothetical protein
MSGTTDIEALAASLLAAKESERQARDSRIVAETALVSALGFCRPEGQQTFDAGSIRVTCKQPLTRKLVDPERALAIAATCPSIRQAIRTRHELDPAQAKRLTDDEWKLLASCVETKPGKVAVTLAVQEVAR